MSRDSKGYRHPWRRWALCALFVYAAAGLALVLVPDRTFLLSVLRMLQGVVGDGLGVRAASKVEFVCNVLLVVPLPLLGAAVTGRRGLALWVGGAAAASIAVEVVQLVLLPGRTPSMRDVLANTLGALVGWYLMRWLGRRRTH